MDRWTIALDIEMMQWAYLIDSLDNLIWWATAQPDHIAIDYADIESMWIDR
jgi:hypothetical protein